MVWTFFSFEFAAPLSSTKVMNKSILTILVEISQYSIANTVVATDATVNSSPTVSSPTTSSAPSTVPDGKVCGENEIKFECQPCSNESTCGNQNPDTHMVCALVCIEGGYCRCRKGFCRTNGECIPCQKCSVDA